MLYYTEAALSHREVPYETSICIYISGCINHCVDCHYPELKQYNYGDPLSKYYSDILNLYLQQASCVCFLGEGSGSPSDRAELCHYVSYANALNLKTCLYCGRDTDIEDWMCVFDYIKLGSYQPSLGPLTSPFTNQRMYKREHDDFINITALFQHPF